MHGFTARMPLSCSAGRVKNTVVSSSKVACKCCVAESSVGAGAAVADLLLSDAILAYA